MVPQHLLATAALLAACAASPPPPSPSDSATALRFEWEPGLRADATLTKTITRLDEPGLTRSASARASFVPEPFRGLVLIRVAADRPAVVGTPLVDFVVTPDGQFVGILDIDDLHARVETMLEDTTPGADLEFELNELMVPEVRLNARVEDLWNLGVGAWVGRPADPGVMQAQGVVDVESRVGVEDPSYDVAVQTSFRRTMPCARAGIERVCADLEYRGSADREDARRVMGVVLRRSGAPEDVVESQLLDVDVTWSFRARTEVEGLVPHEATMTKRVRLSLAEAPKPLEQIETLRAVYSYAY